MNVTRRVGRRKAELQKTRLVAGSTAGSATRMEGYRKASPPPGPPPLRGRGSGGSGRRLPDAFRIGAVIDVEGFRIEVLRAPGGSAPDPTGFRPGDPRVEPRGSARLDSNRIVSVERGVGLQRRCKANFRP